MTREEAKNIVHAIVCAYPNYHPDNLTETVNIWAAMLKEYKYEHISAALKAYILSDTKGFAPSVGQIVDLLTDKQEDMTELEAWAMVSKAIKNGLYGAEEEFAKLPELVKMALGSPVQLSNWAMLPSDTVHSVAQSNFLRAYRSVKEREKQNAKMPKELLEALSERRGLPEDKRERFIAIAEDVR